jgi:tetratricopeptide (TPR) repeat protein
MLEVDPEDLDSLCFERLLGQGRHANVDGRHAQAATLLGAALSLWRGEALGDLAYLPFARLEAERLEELRLAAIEERTDARLALGEQAQVIGELQELFSEHPTRERIARQLMLALYQCERQAEALEIYQRTRSRLVEGLGLEPGPGLKAMQLRILEQAPSLQTSSNVERDRARPPVQDGAVRSAERDAQSSPGVAVPLLPTPTIGRQKERTVTEGSAEALDGRRVEDEPDAPAVSFELAVSHYQQALERASDSGGNPARRGELLVGLGDALGHAGRVTQARDAYHQAGEIAKRLGDPQLLARAALGIAGIGVTILDLDEALAARLAEALQALPRSDFALRAELLARLAITRAYSPDRLESGRIAHQAVRIARRHGNPATLARALCALHVGLGAPGCLEQRLAAASEMLGLAERAGDRESTLQACNFRVSDLLEAGDITAFDREIEAYAAICHEFPVPAFRWYVPLWRATRAAISGDFETAERLAARARHQGHHAGDANAELFWRIQAGTLILAQHRFGEADTAWVEDHARNSPAGAAWWTLLTWIWAEQGRHTDARAVLDRLAERDFSILERDTNWLSGVAELIQASASLQDTHRAAALYQQLAPFSGRIVTAARGALVYGPVDYFLGLAALTALQPRAARKHLTSALNLSKSCDAQLWAYNVRQHLPDHSLRATSLTGLP